MGKLANEFREFVMRGNVIDMAVGVVIGTAFKGIVDSLVNDVIMPPIGYLLGGVDFSQLEWVLKSASEGAEEVAINYGMFINAVISFLIIALVIFLIIKALGNLRDRVKGKKEEVVEVVAPTETELLEEILQELRKQNGEVVVTDNRDELV